MIGKAYVIGITGHMMSGKDTVMDYLSDELRALGIHNGGMWLCGRARLSDPMKRIVEIVWGKETWSTEGKAAEIAPCLTGRDALQQISSFFRGLDEQAWVKATETKIRNHGNPTRFVVIIPDVRLPMETELCDYVLKVDRPSQQAPEKEHQHETETGVDEIVPDSIIVNDGTLDQLQDEVKELVKSLSERIDRA